MSVEFENGLYPASDTTTDMNGSEVKDVLYKKESLGITSWRFYFNEICKIVYNIDSEKFSKIVTDNIIHKSSSKAKNSQKDPIISSKPELLVDAKKIGNTDFYSEGSLSSARARFYAKQLLDMYRITEEVEILVEKREDE